MVFLLLTIACSTSVALMLKYSSVKKGNPIVLLAGNYFVAAVIGFILFLTNSSATYSAGSLLFGVVLGALFVSAFFAFAKAIDTSGTALATTTSRLSVFIPVLLSIIIFDEKPKTFHIIGFVFTAITIVLFYLSLRSDKTRKITSMDYFYLFALLLGIGIGDFCMKIFQNAFPHTDKNFFVFCIFLFAFLYSFAIIIIKKAPVKRHTLLSGGLLGIPNVFASIFLLGALEELSAIIVYPTANVGIIILTAVSAYLIWKEEISRLAKISIFTGILSIALLNF